MNNKVRENNAWPGINLRHVLFGHKGVVSCIAWSPDGRCLATSSFDKTVRLWNPQTGECLKTFEGHDFNVTSVTWAPQGEALATSSDDKKIMLWDFPSGQLLATLAEQDRSISHVAWSPNGQVLVSTAHDPHIHVWDVKKRGRKTTLTGDEFYPKGPAFSPDGKYLAAAVGNQVKLWKGGAFNSDKVLSGHGATVNMVSWAPDGTLATASDDHTVRIWDVSKGKCLTVLEGHEHAVKALSFSSDGHFLATRSWDQTLRIWGHDPWTTVVLLEEDTASPLSSLAFHPNEPVLASIGIADQVVRLWEWEPDQLEVGQPGSEPLSFRGTELALLEARGVDSLGLPKPTAPPPPTAALGAPVPAAAPDTGSFLDWAGSDRAILAILFTDMVDSTTLSNRLGNKEMREIRRSFFERTRELIDLHKGYEIKTMGDAFMVAFRTVSQGLDCALNLRADTGHEEVHIRTALHVGPVDIEEDDAFGAMVNFCARLQGLAGDSEIYLSDEAKNHVVQDGTGRHMEWTRHERVSLKGFSGTHLVWSV